MKLARLSEKFVAAQPILQKIEVAGFEAYFVGGAVRDALLKRPIHDVDIATSAYPEEIKQLFKRTVDTGIKHGTVTVLDHGQSYEVTTFRTESTYQDYRRPDQVTFVRSLQEDLKRRDFTINALAMTHEGKIVDLFDGLTDLHQKTLRAVGNPFERFHEDALRMMRAVRFEAQLDFQLEAKTKAAILDNHLLLEKIAMERIHSEFMKMMLSTHWKLGLNDFISTKLNLAVPGLTDQTAALQDVLAYAGILDNETQVWVFLGRALDLTPVTFKKLLKGWKSSNQVIEESQTTWQLAQTLQTAKKMPLWSLYQSGQSAVKNSLAVLSLEGRIGSADQVLIQQTYDRLPIQSPKELAINGSDLIQSGMKPGPKIGEILEELQKKVIAGVLKNNAKELLKNVQD